MGELHRRLLDDDPARFEHWLREVTKESATSDALLPAAFDVLLYWRAHGVKPPKEAALLVLDWLGSTRHRPGQPDPKLLRTAARELTGFEPPYCSADASASGQPSISDLARAVVAGLPVKGLAPSASDCARACCLMLNRCEYIAAYHWLTVLVSVPARSSHYDVEIGRFVEQARRYLASITALLRSDRMAWEGLLLSRGECRRRELR